MLAKAIGATWRDEQEVRKYMTKTGRSYKIHSSPTAVFMDVGCWQTPDANGSAMTSFGIVSGQYVLLCSWLKMHPAEQNGKRIWESDFFDAIMRKDNASIPPPIERFLYGAGNKGRGFIHKWEKLPVPLTAPKELLIFVGDLHLHLYTGTFVDRFQCKRTGESQVPQQGTTKQHTRQTLLSQYATDELESLDKELRMLLDHADETKEKGNFDVITIQTGDMYEIWETEIILREQYCELLRIWEEFRASKLFDSTKYIGQSMIIMGKLIEQGKVLIDFPFLDLNGRILQNSEMTSFSDDIVEKEGINFWSTDDICKWIRRKHPLLFNGRAKIFDVELRGNHDNFLENLYWPDLSPEKYRNNPIDKYGFLKSKTEGASGENSFDKLITKQIWAEHGHAYDWHNNNDDWSLLEHGFEIVHSVIYGEDSGIRGAKPFLISKLGAKKIKGGYVVPQVADFFTDLCDFEMRLPEIRRTEVIFKKQKLDFYLVVMGHTHDPDLISGRRGKLWANEGIKEQYLRYLGMAISTIPGQEGKYYWTQEKSPDFLKKYCRR